MSWKDDYRDEYDDSGKTWDEFVRTEMHHESELSGLTEQLAAVEALAHEVEALREHVEANQNTYQDMQRELHELRVLLDDE